MLKPLLSFALLCSCLPAFAQQPQLLILGTAHLDNPGRDMVNMKVDDVLTPRRQADIADLVAHIARFKPTRVAIECDPSKQDKWDTRYADYRAGKYTLTRDERDQIGLRLASQLNLPKVDCVDYFGNPPGPDSAYDFPAYAQAHGQQDVMDKLKAHSQAIVTESNDFMRTHPLIDWYRRQNQPSVLKADNAIYFRFAQIGGSDAHPGAAWVGTWHARNLIIVENIRRLAKPDDRIFVIFGAGHGYLLHAFAEDSGAFHIVDTESYLK